MVQQNQDPYSFWVAILTIYVIAVWHIWCCSGTIVKRSTGSSSTKRKAKATLAPSLTKWGKNLIRSMRWRLVQGVWCSMQYVIYNPLNSWWIVAENLCTGRRSSRNTILNVQKCNSLPSSMHGASIDGLKCAFMTTLHVHSWWCVPRVLNEMNIKKNHYVDHYQKLEKLQTDSCDMTAPPSEARKQICSTCHLWPFNLYIRIWQHVGLVLYSGCTKEDAPGLVRVMHQDWRRGQQHCIPCKAH